MNIKIVFPKHSQPDIAKATIAERLCQAASLCINLPDTIEVHFIEMGPVIYGGTIIRPGLNKQIRINISLPINEIIYPITHELIHLSQMHEGKLAMSRTGKYVWEGKTYDIDLSRINYKDYEKLPWELDVKLRQKNLIQQLIG